MRKVNIDETCLNNKKLWIFLEFFKNLKKNFVILLFYSILGEISMKNVKVQRYIPGKRPENAPKDVSDESSNEDYFENRRIVIAKVRDVAHEEAERKWVGCWY